MFGTDFRLSSITANSVEVFIKQSEHQCLVLNTNVHYCEAMRIPSTHWTDSRNVILTNIRLGHFEPEYLQIDHQAKLEPAYKRFQNWSKMAASETWLHGRRTKHNDNAVT